MSGAYRILRTTNTISNVANDKSIDRMRELLFELKEDMEYYELEDDLYDKILGELNEVIQRVETIRDKESANPGSELFSEIKILIREVNSLYLRNLSSNQWEDFHRKFTELIENRNEVEEEVIDEMGESIGRLESETEKRKEAIESVNKSIHYMSLTDDEFENFLKTLDEEVTRFNKETKRAKEILEDRRNVEFEQ